MKWPFHPGICTSQTSWGALRETSSVIGIQPTEFPAKAQRRKEVALQDALQKTQLIRIKVCQLVCRKVTARVV